MTGRDRHRSCSRCPRRRGRGWAGELLGALVAAGAFAAFLSTSSGLMVSVAGTISYDLRRRGPRDVADRRRRFRLAGLIGVVPPIALALAARELDISVLVGWAFALAASTFCPLLLLGIWWEGLTARGAAAGLILGSVAASGIILAGLVVEGGHPTDRRAAQPARRALRPARLRDDDPRLARRQPPPAAGQRPAPRPPRPGGPRPLSAAGSCGACACACSSDGSAAGPPRAPAPAWLGSGRALAASRRLSAISRWLGHGSSRPVRHAGSSPPWRRPVNSSASPRNQNVCTSGSGPIADDLQRADDRAEDAHEARQQPGPHRVQRHQQQRGGQREHRGQRQHLGDEADPAEADVLRRGDRPRPVEERVDVADPPDGAGDRGDAHQHAADGRQVERELDELRAARAGGGGEEGQRVGEREVAEPLDDRREDQAEHVVVEELRGGDLQALAALDRARAPAGSRARRGSRRAARPAARAGGRSGRRR